MSETEKNETTPVESTPTDAVHPSPEEVEAVEAEAPASSLATGQSVEPPPVKEKAAATRTTAKKPSTTQAVDALVTTVTSMAQSVSSLAGTVDSLSERIVAPPSAGAVQAPIPVAQAPADARDESLRQFAVKSAGNLAMFVAVGLVAAAVMREALDMTSAVMVIVGVVLYLANGLLIDRSPTANGAKSVLVHAAMLFVAIGGIGLLVGGIQRFGDEPRRAAVLVPVGAALFLVSAAWNARSRLASEHLVWMAGTGVWMCLFLALGLGTIANQIDPKPKHPSSGVVEVTSTHSSVTTSAPAHGEDNHSTETTVAPAGGHQTTSHDTPAAGDTLHATTSTSAAAGHEEKSTQEALQEAVTAADAAAHGGH